MIVTEEIGFIHSLTQTLILAIYSGGVIFLLPLSLEEITGWVKLGLWTGLNFGGLPLIIKLLDNSFSKNTRGFPFLKMIITGLTGGLLAFPCISFTIGFIYFT